MQLLLQRFWSWIRTRLPACFLREPLRILSSAQIYHTTHPLVEVFMSGRFALQDTVIGKRWHRPIILRSLDHGDELSVSFADESSVRNPVATRSQLTRRPHGPNSCTLPSSHLSSFIPSTIGISIASYSSVIVGRKKTSRPPGTSIYRASLIRSRVRCVSS